MNKEEILQALEQKSEKDLKALYLIAASFSSDQLEIISRKVQNKATKQLILKYL